MIRVWAHGARETREFQEARGTHTGHFRLAAALSGLAGRGVRRQPRHLRLRCSLVCPARCLPLPSGKKREKGEGGGGGDTGACLQEVRLQLSQALPQPFLPLPFPAESSRELAE